MNEFEIEMLKYLGEENLKKVQSIKIGIAGAGGLGSNCALNLVRTGFRKLKIIDFDIVEMKNLNRQFYFFDQVGSLKVEVLKRNLERINEDVEIEAIEKTLDKNNIKEVFADCPIVVEAFDKADCKKMLVESLLSSKELIVSGSGLAGMGNSDDIKINRLKDNLVIVGDFKSGVREDLPPLAPRVNIAAAKQADVVLEYIIKK